MNACNELELHASGIVSCLPACLCVTGACLVWIAKFDDDSYVYAQRLFERLHTGDYVGDPVKIKGLNYLSLPPLLVYIPNSWHTSFCRVTQCHARG